MDVAPHPHIGLQTVTWLLDGEVMHADDLGSESLLRPGSVNVMTSGSGIAHAEQTPLDNSGRLNGVQLWVALTETHRHMAASFVHVRDVPVIESSGGRIRVFAGAVDGVTSPAPHYSEIVGADLELSPGHSRELPLNIRYEHAVLVLSGDFSIDGEALDESVLYYLGTARSSADFSSRGGGRILLIGGPPFPEAILMWWRLCRTDRG